MKFTTINLGETKIEFRNSFFGKETVLVNGEQVASEWTFSGTAHEFTVSEKGEEARYILRTGLGVMGMMFGLSRNGIPVIEFPKSKGWTTLVFISFLLVILAYVAKDLIGSLHGS